jgi:hypothetical protein
METGGGAQKGFRAKPQGRVKIARLAERQGGSLRAIVMEAVAAGLIPAWL